VHATDGRDGVASVFLRTPQLPNVFGLPQFDVFDDSLRYRGAAYSDTDRRGKPLIQ
jgi:hypothetical protein